MYLARVRPHVQSQTPGGRGLCELPMSYIYSIALTFISLNPFCGSKSIGDCSGSCLGFFSKPAGRLGDKLFSDQVSAFLSWEEGIWQGGTKGKRGLIWWNDAYHKHTWINFWKEEAGNAQTSCSSHHKRWWSLQREGPDRDGEEVPEVVTGQSLVAGSSHRGTSQKTEIGWCPRDCCCWGSLCEGVPRWHAVLRSLKRQAQPHGLCMGSALPIPPRGILKKRQEQRECFHLRFDTVPARLWEQLLAIFGLG